MAATPKKKRGETWVAYHDRLVARVHEATEAGMDTFSAQLQRAAGKVAREHPDVREKPRTGASRGPGTYPWNACIDDQNERGSDMDRAKNICGRIRATSRERYPDYWAAREEGVKKAKAKKGTANPSPRRVPAGNPFPLVALGAHSALAGAGEAIRHVALNPESAGVPFCALGLDGGPHVTRGSRDVIVVVDQSGVALEVVDIYDVADIDAFTARYPDLPQIGKLHVMAKDLRRMRREAAQRPPVIQTRRGRGS